MCHLKQTCICHALSLTCSFVHSLSTFIMHPQNNRLGGEFPRMDGFPQLHVLHVENNQIGGVIPASIAAARKLTVFDASRNK